VGTVVSEYGSPKSDEITYSLSDESEITISLVASDSSFAGYAPVGNNPGDLGYGTGTEYYNGVIGSYQGQMKLGVYSSREQGFFGLFDYLGTSNYILNYIVNHPSATIGEITAEYFAGSQDVSFLTSFGLNADLQWTVAVNSSVDTTLWAEAIMRGEGGDDAVKISISLPGNETVDLANAYDENFVNPSFGVTEIDLDNDTTSKIVDGSLWYIENTDADTATFASNISQTYSSNIDHTFNTAIRPSSDAVTTPPVFTLGSIDTDTFYHLGDGSTIIAGAAGYTLSVIDLGGTGYLEFADPTHTQDEDVLLPSGFMIVSVSQSPLWLKRRVWSRSFSSSREEVR